MCGEANKGEQGSPEQNAEEEEEGSGQAIRFRLSDEEKKGYTELEMATSKRFIHLMTCLQMPQNL